MACQVLTLNSESRNNTWLSYYPLLIQDLDITYGGPFYYKKTTIKGRKALEYILEYLSDHKQSACEDIAQAEYDNNLNSKRKLKSITDDTRKFINKNLIPRRIIEEDGFKKKYNKKVKTYSLTPFGILYSIHFFSESEKSTKTINNLEKEYQDTLPKIFGKFSVFKEIFGEEYLDVIGLQRIADYTHSNHLFDALGILGNFVHHSGWVWLGEPLFLLNRWGDQISLLVYTSILSHLLRVAVFEYINSGEEPVIVIKKKISDFWKKLNEIDPELEKWYMEFVKEFISNNEKEKKDVSEIMWWKR